VRKRCSLLFIFGLTGLAFSTHIKALDFFQRRQWQSRIFDPLKFLPSFSLRAKIIPSAARPKSSMQKLPSVLLFVVLALVVLNIATLRQLDRLEKRVLTLEQKMPPAVNALTVTPAVAR
jgi:hypothetical protein